MALSNIGQEPRREITESIVGMALVGSYFFGDYKAVIALGAVRGPEIVIGMLFGILATIVFLGFLFLTHELGEWICGLLADRGLELRPKNRPGRR